MAKIICPHCSATNQDVTTDDPCWKCGTLLGASVSALDTGSGPPTSAANAGQPSAAPIPTTVQVPRPEPTPSPTKQPVADMRPNRQRTVTLVVISVVLVVISLLLLVMDHLMRHH